MSRSLPTAIGPYRVLARLGGGGMADVFLVERTALGDALKRRLALKRVRPDLIDKDQDDFVSAFRSEVNITSQLEHPNIVQAFDAGAISSGEDQGSCYLVMEFVDGTHLGQLARQVRLATGTTLPPDIAAHVALKLAEALEYAHSHPLHVIHRDISPHNVLLSIYGEVKLADFGIARYESRQHRTATDQIKGKVAYMSPEQIDERLGLDPRSDLFSLGIVLYEMLSGVNPFRTSQQADASIMRAIRYDGTFVPLDKLCPHLAPDMVALVHRLLAHDKHDRPERARTVITALEPLCDAASPRRLAELVREALAARAQPSAAATATTAISLDAPPPGWVAVDGLGEPDEAEEDELEDDESAELDLSMLSPSDVQDHSAVTAQSTTRPATPARASGHAAPPKAPHARAYIAAAAVLVLLIGAGAALTLRRGRDDAVQHTLDETTAAAAPRPPGSGSSSSASPPAASPATSQTASHEPLASESTINVPAATAPTNPRRRPADKNDDAETATLNLIVIPWGNVWLDGEFLGNVDGKLIPDLKPGPHVIEVGREAPVKSRRVRLHPGDNTIEMNLK